MKKVPKHEMIGAEVRILLDTLRRLHRKGATDNCRKMLMKLHPADLAFVFRFLTAMERQEFFQMIAKTDLVADFLSELDEAIMVGLVQGVSASYLAEVVASMAPDDAADLLHALPDEVEAEVRTQMEAGSRHEIEELLKFHPKSAGGIMSTDFMRLDENLTVEEAMNRIQERSGENGKVLFYLYIFHGDGQLAGVLSLGELLLHPRPTQLKSIMNTKVISVTTDTDQETVAHLVSKYDLLALPVVDASFHLVGIITVDDVIDVIREETAEDFLQMAGAGKDREILFKSTLQNAWIRAPWLFASWVAGVVAIFIISYFEGELMQVLVLASFIPIVMGMGGNIAVQSSTIMVRGITTGRVHIEDFFRVIFKEMRVGVILGLIYGLLIGLLAWIGFSEPAHLGFVVGISVIIVMTVAATIGTAIPLVLKRMKIDAAVATGPFVTSAIDIVSVILYFLVAKILLGL